MAKGAEAERDPEFAALIHLDGVAVLRIEGPDAVAFLQGQVTCDVKSLPEGRIALGAMCNPKGRVIAVFRLIRQDTRCHFILRSDMAEVVRNRLQRYVLRSKVTIDDGEWSALGLLGARDKTFAEDLGLTTAPDFGQVASTCGGALLLCLDRNDKLLLLAPNEETAAVESRWLGGKRAARGTPAAWERAEIADGVPTVTPITTEEFIPQMINLDLLGGISFTKGCYTGQEVIARTRYLGTVKRRMHRFQVCCDHVPEAGARLVGESGGHLIGHVVRAVPVDESCCELLAVVGNDALRSHAVRLWSSSGPALKKMALPIDGRLEDGTTPVQCIE